MNILVLRHPWFFELDILVSTAALLSPKSDGRKTVDERSGTSSDQCSKPSVLPFYWTGWWIGFPIHVLSFNPFFASVKSQQKCRLNPTSEVSELPLLNRLHQKGYSTPASRLLWNVVDSWTMQLTSFGTIWSFQKMLKKNSSFFSGEFFFNRFREVRTISDCSWKHPRHLVPSSNSLDCREYLKGWEGTIQTSLEACKYIQKPWRELPLI